MTWFGALHGGLLAATALLGGITSFEDFREGKIRNRWIFWAILVGLCLHLAGGVLQYLDSGTIRLTPLVDLSVNSLIALAAGYGLWRIGVWVPADGKLFFAFSFLVPLSGYAQGYMKLFPAATILVNTFAVGLVFLVVQRLIERLSQAGGGIATARTVFWKPLFKQALSLLPFVLVAVVVAQSIRVGAAKIGPWAASVLTQGLVMFGLMLGVVMALRRLRAVRRGRLALAGLGVGAGLFLYAVAGLPAGREVLKMVLMAASFTVLMPVAQGFVSRGVQEESALPFAPFLFTGTLLTIFTKQSVIHIAARWLGG